MIQPRLLSRGDRVAIIAPAGHINKNAIDRAIDVLSSWGLEVVKGRHLYGRDGYFSGTDQERLTDLQNAMADPTVAAILFARGGYGTTRIVDHIMLETLKHSPKWLIGFSDLTALHLKLLKEKIVSIHGDVGTTLGQDDGGTESLKSILFEGVSAIESSEPLRLGKATGQLTGGNLSLIVDSLGTKTEIETDGRILFLEEIEEKTYRIDRMLHQLERAGKLSMLAGLVIGHFTSITDGSTPFGASWKQCIEDIVSRYSFPVAFGFAIGHEPANCPVIHGATYQLKVSDDLATLSLA